MSTYIITTWHLTGKYILKDQMEVSKRNVLSKYSWAATGSLVKTSKNYCKLVTNLAVF